METVPIREFNRRLYSYLDRVPLIVTSWGTPVLVVSPPTVQEKAILYPKRKGSKVKRADTTEDLKEVLEYNEKGDAPLRLCKHGFPKSTCKLCPIK